MEYNLHKMMQQQQQNRVHQNKNQVTQAIPVQGQLKYAQVNLFESPLQRANALNSGQKPGHISQLNFGGPYNVMGQGSGDIQASQLSMAPPPSVSKFENNMNNKTRNITQVPSLKSSPLQRVGMMPAQIHQEEDFVDDEFNLQTDEGGLQMRQPKLHVQMSERRNAHMNLELIQNPLPGNVQRPQIPLYHQRLSGPGTSKHLPSTGSAHQRGASLFEVKRATAHLTNGLANHQQLQRKALASGELGLEEHVPISPMHVQSAAYGGRAQSDEQEDDDEDDADQDVDDIDEMCVMPHQRSQMETEQDLEGHMDGIEDDEKAESPGQQIMLQQKKQDSPGLQIFKLEHGSSQEGNIPHSSHSSSTKKSPHNYHQSASSFKQKLSQERYGVQVDGFMQKSSEKQPSSYIQSKEIHENFKINPYLINLHRPNAGSSQSSATPNQMKIQQSLSLLHHQPLHKQSSYSSFMKAQSSQATQQNSMIKRPPSHQKKQNCNETVEDENDVEIAVPHQPNGSGSLHQSLNFSTQYQMNRIKASDIPSNIIQYKPNTLQSEVKKPNTASSSILSAPGDTQSLLQSIHSRVVQYNQRERDRDRSRSNSESKFSRLQKLPSKNLIKEEISPSTTNLGSTKQKVDLPEVVFTSFNGVNDKNRKAQDQKKQTKDESEKFGDLSSQPQTNFIGPNPAILKNQQQMITGKLGRVTSNTARPNDHQSDEDDGHLIDPKDQETEKLRQEYLNLKKTLNQLKNNNTSVQQFDTKRSLDKRKSEQSQTPFVLPEQKIKQQKNEVAPPIIVESLKASTVTSPKQNHAKQRIVRPNSSCLTEKQPQLIPSAIQSEFNFSNGISQQQPPQSISAAGAGNPNQQVKRQFINLETTHGEDLDNLSHSSHTSSQDKRMKKSKEDTNLPQKSYVPKHHSNTTKISRRRQMTLKSRDKSENQSFSLSSCEDGLTENIQKCIEGSGAAHEQVTESDNTGEKHLIISTLKSSKGGKFHSKQDKKQNLTAKHQPQNTKRHQQQISYNDEESDENNDSSSNSSNAGQYNTAPRGIKRNKKYSPDDGDDECESSERKVVKKGKRQARAANKNVENKSRKERKQLKININMNSVTGAPSGGQYVKPESVNLLQSNEELMQKLQQQQLLLAQIATQAYANPQNFLLQQQLAFQQQQLLLSQSLLHPAAQFMGGLGLQNSQSHPFALQTNGFMGMNPAPVMTNFSVQHMQSQLGNFSDLTSSYGGNPMHTQSMHIHPNNGQNNPSTFISSSIDRTNVFFQTHDDHFKYPQAQTTQRSQYQNDETATQVEGTPSPARRNTVFSNLRQVINSGGTQRGKSNGNKSVLNRLASPKDPFMENNPHNQSAQVPQNQINRQLSARPSIMSGDRTIREHQSDYQQMGLQKQIHSRNIPISQNYSSPIKNLIAVAVSSESHPRTKQQYDQDEIKRLTSTYDKTVGEVPKIDLMRRTVDSLPAKEYRPNDKIPLEHKRTGHFGVQEDKKDLFLIQNQDPLNAESSSQESIEECQPINTVIKQENQLSATHSQIQASGQKPSQIQLFTQSGINSLDQTRQLTPETNFNKFGDSPMKLLNQEEKKQINEILVDQDRKEPQAILIGFDDFSQVKDPFQNKPALKPREKAPEYKKPNIPQQLSARSKSAKGNFSQNGTGSTLVARIALSKAEKDIKAKQDSQFSSPMRSGTTAQIVSPSKDLAISQMKRAVLVLQNDKDPQTAKQTPNIITIDVKQPSTQKRPATSKVALGSAKTSITTDHQAFTQAAQASSNQRIPIKERILNQKKNEEPSISKFTQNQQSKVNKDDEEEIQDPSHNKNLPIEIFDVNQKKHSATQHESEPSLADMFKQKKKNIVEKLAQRKLHTGQSDQDNIFSHESQQDDQDCQQYNHLQTSPSGKTSKLLLPKKEKTKEELFQLRKQMMKSKVKKPQENFGGQGPTPSDQTSSNGTPLRALETASVDPRHQKDPKQDLMKRLAQGKKTQVDMREMKRLTNKNYQNLPEIRKKREEEAKKQENQARKAATQEYLRQLDEARKKKAAAVQKRRAQGIEQGIKESYQ